VVLGASLTAVTAVLLVLLIAAIFGRIHRQSGEGARVEPLGDRIIAGLLALPLITGWVKLVFPDTHIAWALAAPVPLAIYIILLAGTDPQRGFRLAQEHFNQALLIGVGIFYVILAAVALAVVTQRLVSNRSDLHSSCNRGTFCKALRGIVRRHP
jgi:hypothetical protein